MTANWTFIPQARPNARLRLFCFHPAGKGASIFSPWVRLFPDSIELCCIQLPGRESRLIEAPYQRLEPIIDALDECLFPLLDRPYAIFGASLGAVVGFELARRLRLTYNISPAHLFLASRRSPWAPDRLPPISHLPDSVFIDEVQNRYHSIPEEIRVDKKIMELFLPLLRADFKAIESFAFVDGEPFQCPLTALRGSADSIVLPEDLDGWGQHTRGHFSQFTFTGDHFFFINNGIAEFVAGKLLPE